MNRISPLACLESAGDVVGEKIAVIVLNKDSPAHGTDPVFTRLWKKAAFRACTDGGANYVYDLQKKATNGNTPHMPDLVSGDFDSIRPEVKQFYENQEGVEVKCTYDQDETDFTKCIRIIGDKLCQKAIDVNLVVALAGRQDRFDHSMANICTLYRCHDILPEGVKICIIFDRSYVTLLPGGNSVIDVNTGLEGRWCGLIPIGRPVTLTTTGLKWNLTNGRLEFGHLVSTSNELDGSLAVTVDTDHPVVWTMEFQPEHN